MGSSESKVQLIHKIIDLSKKTIDASEHAFWNELFETPTTCEELFSSIQPCSTRDIRASHPENLVTLLNICLKIVEEAVSSPTSLNFKKLINAIRVLTRTIPFLLETDEDNFLANNFYTPQYPKKKEEVEEAEGDNQTEIKISFGQRLVNSLMSCLFLPGFTIPGNCYIHSMRCNEIINKISPDIVDTMLIWFTQRGGIVLPQYVEYYTSQLNDNVPDTFPNTSATEINNNRIELLKLLVTCCSSELYDIKCDNTMSQYLTSKDTSLTHTFFYSIVNILCSFDPCGYGIPYFSTIGGTADEDLVVACLHLMDVLLNYRPDNINDNIYYKYINDMDKKNDFTLIASNIQRILNSIIDSNNTILPGSQHTILCEQEILLFLWRLLDTNNDFLSYISSHYAVDYTTPLFYLMCEGRSNHHKVGLVHMVTFIVMLLSSEREYAVNLNKPFKKRLPLDIPSFYGSFSDYVIIIIYKMVTESMEEIKPLHSIFITILFNISSYTMKLSLFASEKLLTLFEILSKKNSILANEFECHKLALLIKTMANLLIFHYEGNMHVLYSILVRRGLFHKLSNYLNMAYEQFKPKEFANGTAITEEWYNSFKQEMEAFEIILKALNYVLPQVDELCTKAGGIIDEEAVVEYLNGITLVGILPVHGIEIQRYSPNQYTNQWFTQYLWGIIYIRNQIIPLFDSTKIKIFAVEVRE